MGQRGNVRIGNIMEHRREDCGVAGSDHCLRLAGQGIPRAPNGKKLEIKHKHVALDTLLVEFFTLKSAIETSYLIGLI